MKKGLIIFAAACAIITGITFASCSNMLEDLRNAGKKIILVSGYKGETIEFGSWPQSEAENITASNLTATGKKYDGENEEYKDAENNYYVKVGDKYYKVEPITWRVIAYYSDGSKLLLADKIYSRIPYYGTTSNRDLSGTTIYPNNYKYSNIRAYLNSTKNQFVTDSNTTTSDDDWAGKGFLTSAFTGDELAKIKTTAVDNSAASTGYDLNEYACENTEDKVHLLSYKEATNPLYGLSKNADRIMQATDYARANGAGGDWWLRSPSYRDSDSARYILYDGDDYYYYYVNDWYVGVVPALTVNNLYTVTFDTDGGSAIPKQTVSKGEKVVKPTVPIKTDDEDNLYEFLGWYNGKTKYDFDATVGTDITLKAKWNKIKLESGYTVEEKYSFGSWPQSKVTDITGITFIDSDRNRTYDGKYKEYLGSDNLYYVKVGETYYKVEPIQWRVIATYSDGSKLLLADKIYSRIPYYGTTSNRDLSGTTIYPNNYKYSNIRAYLNSTKNQFVTDSNTTTSDDDWAGKGFLTSAFTGDELAKIKTTAVDNSVASTGYDSNEYACENTEDKVYLLSYKEATNPRYGLGNNEYRIMQTTDYAIANGAYQSITEGAGGFWWLRSPYYYNSYKARHILHDGDYTKYDVYVDDVGVVPALTVTE